jgi:hypothetical protein
MRIASFYVLIALGCGEPAGVDGGSADAAAIDAGGSFDAGAPFDGGGSFDAGAGHDAGACVPSGGSTTNEGYCQQVMLSVLRSDDASPELFATGITTSIGEGCAQIDRVDVLHADGELIQTLDQDLSGAGYFRARASTVAPEIAALCDREDGRFDPFAVEVHGRVDGGTFVARCGAEEFGSGWPPELVVSCHQNLPVGPTYMGSGGVQITGMFTVADLRVMYPNVDGIVIDSVASTARVIPGTWGFGSMPIAPFDTTGWTTSVGFPTSAQEFVLVQMFASMDLLGEDVCPVPSTMPMPMDPPPPVFLLAIRGMASGRPFTSEAFINYCYRTVTPGP